MDRLESITITDAETNEQHVTAFTYFSSFDRATQTETVITPGQNDAITVNRSFGYNDLQWLDTITDQLSGGSIAYIYDDNGNTLSKLDTTKPTSVSTSFSYNQRNQLKQVIQGSSSQGQYDYNYAGMRILHQGSSRGDISYYHDDMAVIDEHANGSQYAHYSYADRLISLKTPDDTQYYHFSALNTTANLTDESGAIKASYRTDSFG